MSWEYLTVKTQPDWGLLRGRSLDCDAMNAQLNRLGREGWELISAFDINAFRGESLEVVLIFKRPRDGVGI